MKHKLSPYLLIVFIVSLGGLYFYGNNPEGSPVSSLSPQELAAKQLASSALSSQGIWSQKFLSQHTAIKDKIIQLEKGTLCKGLKELDTKHLTHRQLRQKLKDMGFSCFVRPLAENPMAFPLKYLKIDDTVTENPREPGVAHQEICYERTQPTCVMRLKRDGFPLNKRPTPHSTKAVLLNPHGDPGSYGNEAFKVGAQGQAIPKGPRGKFGLRKCPFPQVENFCSRWVDAIMEAAHPALKEPILTPLNP